MSKINDGGPAFPGGLYEHANAGSNDRQPYNDGMSLRDWFAGQAMAAMVSQFMVKRSDCDDPYTEPDMQNFDADALVKIAPYAWEMADEMLKARNA